MRDLVEEARARWAVMGELERQIVGSVLAAALAGAIALCFAYLEVRVKQAAVPT